MASFARTQTAFDSSAPKGPPTNDAPHLERYELLAEIARGGMGVVYRAKDRTTGDICALKCVRTDGNPDADLMLAGLEREYQVLWGLKHPRIIRVFDYGLIADGAYYTMELLDGADLRRRGPVPWRETCQYLRDIATCLSLLHARRLIHRDLSPGNVKLTGDGHCKLIDFGALVEFGQTEHVIGTPPFIAPEVLSFGRLDQRVDLYALGALGYYCLTGRHAYPVARISALRDAFRILPPPPAQLNPEVPSSISELVMSLLREDPLARPATAAEVIARLDVIGDLPAEDETSQRLLVQSYLAAPRYVGRKAELQRFDAAIILAAEGRGQALRVVAPAGAGRTRLLEEVAIRAQLTGAAVARADGSAQHGPYALLRVLSHALLNAAPEAARTSGSAHCDALAVVDPALVLRVLAPPPGGGRNPFEAQSGLHPTLPPPSREQTKQASSTATTRPKEPIERGHGVESWFLEVSRERPLVLLIDNVDYADDASVGALLALARDAQRERIVLVVVEQDTAQESNGFGLGILRSLCAPVALAPLSRAEVAELIRSLFGDAPRAERLAEWLHTQTAGSPLHCMGLVRDLIAQGLIHHQNGVWLLPSDRPQALVSEALDDALARRLASLSVDALELAQCLSLSRIDSTLDMCRRLVPADAAASAPALLEELIANDVLQREQDRVSFTSAALCQAVVKRMGAPARRRVHLRLGTTLSELARPGDRALRIEAGWQLIRGGEEMRGADMIAEVTRDANSCAKLVATLFRLGAPAEAALKVYRRARKTRRERMPLLTALTLAGYYEHYRFSDAYGDEALDVAEELTGFALARRLKPYLGGILALVVGLGTALVRHYLAPKRTRWGSFHQLVVHLCGVVTTMCGVAAIALDAERCDRVAAILSPATLLPRRLAIAGIYKFCHGLQFIAREDQAEAFERFDELAVRFADPNYYLLLPHESRLVYITACHFARGAFAMMRAHGGAALESADILERSGLPLYMMIGSQLRYLYHLNRGELGAAQVHREAVELHAARAGSAWQVELWEPASLLPFYIAADDLVELARIAQRLAGLAEDVPSMWRYREFAYLAAELHTHRPDVFPRVRHLLAADAPRSFIGWSTALAGAAIHFNQRGEYAQARALTELVSGAMTDRDREYVMIFLLVDLQSAIASAGLGEVDNALALLDHLIALYGSSDHALALGLVHETRARIALEAGRRAIYEESAPIATRFLRATGTPTLVARADRLLRLGQVATPQPTLELLAQTELMISSSLAADTRLASVRQ